MLALLLDTELSSTQRDYAQTAQVCGKALIALINEVLDRAKIEAGKLELEMVPFDIRSILDDVLSLFSEKSRHKGIEVSPALSVLWFSIQLLPHFCLILISCFFFTIVCLYVSDLLGSEACHICLRQSSRDCHWGSGKI